MNEMQLQVLVRELGPEVTTDLYTTAHAIATRARGYYRSNLHPEVQTLVPSHDDLTTDIVMATYLHLLTYRGMWKPDKIRVYVKHSFNRIWREFKRLSDEATRRDAPPKRLCGDTNRFGNPCQGWAKPGTSRCVAHT